MRHAIERTALNVELNRSRRKAASDTAQPLREGAMILVRDVFQIHPDQMRAAKAAMRELRDAVSNPLPASSFTGEYISIIQPYEA